MPYSKKALDGRTRTQRSIKNVKAAISSNLDAGAAEILREDIASLTVVGRLCLQQALKDPKKTVDAKGNLHRGMVNYLKIRASIGSGLGALKKFQAKSPAGLFDDTEDAD